METQTVFCIIKPDKIFRFWKADPSHHVSLYQQTAEGADIVFKRSFGICFFRYWSIKHQSGAFNETPVGGVNGSGSGYCTGICQIICL